MHNSNLFVCIFLDILQNYCQHFQNVANKDTLLLLLLLLSLLTMRDIKFVYDSFYKTSEKITQDNFILKHCSVTDPKRSRKREQEKNKPKSMSVK
ncbi:unnamed protein product [Acanthoscelides obtectus]|uniref:Uncharacterized protein n=1 Tax=Acanthoscelides obtectus TaxID=200917 RepID=A0A9P0P287_ACAOB|nr:unnamed protein product [Acanthoscelides obtectus]CAK1643743.1 hypothetical protein AOBTE_LOCUS13657 [Acanthoscelides obtectus]